MRTKPKARFLSVVWGARYVEEFTTLSLPSYLSPGNLPALAEQTDLEIVILTTRPSRPYFEKSGIFQRLRDICEVRFIHIDDLVTNGVYGVTLTLAYARGIRDAGAEQVNTHFVFMNSDFVLADGSLRHVGELIRQGKPCVMAPSLRACAEPVIPRLQEREGRTGAQPIPPRELVRIAFEHLHPTVVGKTITQELVRCRTHNQLYWQVDPSTMLGRCHLIFMLMIKPEVPLDTVRSYCDYGFVPRLVPSGDFHIVGDSDDVFMLELSPSLQERQFLRLGQASLPEIAKELSAWTTREHRAFACHDAVFHWRDLPDTLDDVSNQAEEFVKSLHQQMPEPLDDLDHYYWVLGVQHWMRRRRQQDGTDTSEDPDLPPELHVAEPDAKRDSDSGGALRTQLQRLYLAVVGLVRARTGEMPRVAPWHHEWLDAKLLRDWVATLKPDTRLLVVDRPSSAMAAVLPETIPVEFIRASSIAREGTVGNGRFDEVFLHVVRADVGDLSRLLEQVLPAISPNGRVTVFINNPGGEHEPSNFTYELPNYLPDILPKAWIGCRLRARFAGGPMKRFLRRAEGVAMRNLAPPTLKRLPHFLFALCAWPTVAAAIAVNNFRHRKLTSHCPSHCSSVLLTLEPRWQADICRSTDRGEAKVRELDIA